MSGQALAAFLAELDPRQLALPVPAAVLARAATLQRPAPPSAAELVALAGVDPVLAGTLLRAGNATYYAGLPRVSSLAEAVRRIGCETARQVLADACREGAAAARPALVAHRVAPLWRHSLGCAVGARWLARRCGYAGLAEPAYLAGLLHDCGKYLLLAGFARQGAEPAAGTPLDERLAAEVLAALHVDSGVRLAAAWHFPDEIARSAARHHETGLDPQDLLVALVKLANQGCRKLGLGGPAEAGLVLPTTGEAQLLNLDEIALAEFEIMLEDRFQLPSIALDKPQRCSNV